MAPRTVHTRESLRVLLDTQREDGRTIALVPTMGNLHRGHLSLVECAAREADLVVVSIFVNPTQFGPGEDYARYPRTLEADLEALADSACSVVYAPDVDDLYPFGVDEAVRITAPPALANRLCGASRPGHFDGVLTIVARLLLVCAADCAVFGEKDYQQWLLIERMCADLGIATRIVRAPTVRDEHGLALSSRNAYLDERERRLAAALHATLLDLAGRLRDGRHDHAALAARGRAALAQQGFDVDYLEIVDPDTLAPASRTGQALRILVAARLGGARLIDNLDVPATRVL
jgi:pantoate--beta-alanine ligase